MDSDHLRQALKSAMDDTLSDGIDSMAGYTLNREELRQIGCYLIGWFNGRLRIELKEQDRKLTTMESDWDTNNEVQKQKENISLDSLKNVLSQMCITDAMEKVKKEPDFAKSMVRSFQCSKGITCWDAAEIFVSLPEEMQMELLSKPGWVRKMQNSYDGLHPTFHACPEVQELHQKLHPVSEVKTEEPKVEEPKI